MTTHIEKTASDVIDAVRGFVSRSMAPLLERVKAIEERTPERGEKGVQGDAGGQGAPGAHGLDGKPGEPGKDGEDGRDGKDGERGADGSDGRDGEPGKDALRIEPIDSIESERSYSRNTYAVHRGGLWRSVRATDPLAGSDAPERAGWAIVVNGVETIDAAQGDDQRTFTLRATCSNGSQREWKFALPAMIYLGVYAEGKEYAVGDCVTWGGSVWYCDAPTKDKPRESDAWRLAVKHGRDGRDKA